MKFVNLTPHKIYIIDDGGNIILSLPPSGDIARVTSGRELVGDLGPVPVFKTVFDVIGLPNPTPGTIFVVSPPILSALAAKGVARDDVVAPDTLPGVALRGYMHVDGHLVGLRGFQRL